MDKQINIKFQMYTEPTGVLIRLRTKIHSEIPSTTHAASCKYRAPINLKYIRLST